MARLIDRLESRGMVERRPDPTDRRCWRLHLTDASRPLLGDIGIHLDDVARILCADLSEETLCEVATAVAHMRDRAQDQKGGAIEAVCERVQDVA